MKNFLALIGIAVSVVGQSNRDAYRQAYDAWQQAQANLERDAGTGGDAQVSQADRAGAAAAAFEAARAAYLKSSAQDAAQRRQILQTPFTSLSPDLAPPAVADLAARELQTVTRTAARFANDPDRGIQQLRQALERERLALTALSQTIQARQKTVAAASETFTALEQARTKTAEAFGAETSQLSQAADQVEKESAAWAGYYASLSQAIQVAIAPPPPPVAPVAPRNDAISRIPLPRFVGEWTYPVVNGIFHGPQPESVELVVHEQNGHADGTFSGKFKLSPGSATDTSLKFDFEGDFTATPTQHFKLVTSDGAAGTLELIPGPAFNLLEVNFQTDPQPNKIRLGNFILVKK